MPLLGVISNIATASRCFVFPDLRPPFPQVHLSVWVGWGGVGGGGGGGGAIGFQFK